MKSLNFKYLISITIIITIVLGSIFSIFYGHIKRLAFEQIYQKAKVIANQVIIMRKWVADMRGVYVIQRKGIEPNRFLPYPVLTCGELTLVLRNPALVTKELSDRTRALKSYFYKLTSDKVINPANMPDTIEKQALKLFKTKKISEFKVTENGYFRLIKPLYVKDSCLTCHVYQGYHLGELRGALSIFVPIKNVLKDLKKIKKIFLIGGILIVFFTTFIIYFANYFLTIKPIVNLTKYIKRFRDNFDTNYPPVKREDEIGELEKSFVEMALKIKNNYNIIEKEIEKATEELKRRDRIKTDFIATISHELRTPLTTIQGGIEYLFKVLKKDENIEFLKIIDKNLKNLILMVNNLIDIARIELGKLELEIVEVNIKELIDEIILFFKGFSHEKGIEIVKENFLDFNVKIDRRRMNQVFINILHNAIKYSPENEKVYISMEKLENFLKISFKNKTKKELSKKDLKKFFEKYKYLSSGKEKGSGLGLAIAKAIVEAHGGKIEVILQNNNFIYTELYFEIKNG